MLDSIKDNWTVFLFLSLIAISIALFSYLYQIESQDQLRAVGILTHIANPFDRSENLTLTMNLYSVTFAAQDDITAFVRIDTNSVHRHTSNNTEGQYLPAEAFRINFDQSYCGEPEYTYDVLQFCSFLLKPTDNLKNRYEGNGTVIFSYDGNFDVFLSDDRFATNEWTKVGQPVIHVAPLEAYNSYQADKSIIRLAILAIQFTLVGLAIEFVRRGWFKRRDDSLHLDSSSPLYPYH